MNNTSTFPGRFILAADITLQSPMHIGAIEKGRYVFDGVSSSKIIRYDAGPGAGIQCSLTRTMRLSNQSYEYKTDEGPRIRYGVDVPVIPASTVRGMMRQSAGNLLLASLVQRDMTLSTDAYNTLMTGSATTSLNADAATPEVFYMARRDAFFANFGGTSFALAARSAISTGMPIIQMTRDMLMSPPLLDPLGIERLDDMTSAIAVVRKDAVRDMDGPHIHQVIPLDDIARYHHDKAVEMTAAAQNKAAQKAAKTAGESVEKDKKRDIRTLSAFESVNCGVSFALRLQVDAVSEAHLGLMVLALQDILRKGLVGAKTNTGLGQFVCEQSRIYQINPATNQPMSEAGDHLFAARSTGYAVIGADDEDHSPLATAIDAAKDYIEDIQPDLIEAFASTNVNAIKAIYKSEPITVAG